MEHNFISVCGGGQRPFLALSEDGRLFRKMPGKEWEDVNFQECYKGYYPDCLFGAIAATDVDYIAAGIGQDGLPYVFRSLLCSVWEMVNLTGGNRLGGYVRASGRVNEILYDSATKQIFLLCDNAELVVLPDCPKCVKITKPSDCSLLHGRIEDGILYISTLKGEMLKVPVCEAMQIRVSLSYARQQVQKGGQIIDLRQTDPDGLPEILDGLPKDRFLGFICEYGIRSDEAAQAARQRGFEQAYSLGGSNILFHEE